MNVYLISFDLVKEDVKYEQKRDKIIEIIHKCAFARLADNCYVIETQDNLQSTNSIFTSLLDKNDKFHLFNLQGEYTSQSSQAVKDWLFKKLKF